MSTKVNQSFMAICNLVIVVAMTLSLIVSLPRLTSESYAAGGIDWGQSVGITSNGQVVDSITVNGKKVDAMYAPRGNVSNYDTDQTYCCAAFVKRFYKNVFGVDVWNLYPGNTPEVSSGSFTKTTTPKVGDIAGNYEHWAIVKSVSGDKVTVIEQNAWSSDFTCAKVGRGLYSDSGYWYWRWSGNNADASSQSGTGDKAKIKVKSTVNFSFMIQPVQAGSTNATIYTKVNNPDRVHVQQVGCNIYDSSGKLIKSTTEKCSRKESVFNIWYDLNSELGLTLSSKTNYQYEFFIDYNGFHFVSQRQSFSTI